MVRVPDPGPLHFLQIEPTTRCNFTCGFCAGRQMEQGDLELSRFAAALEAAPELRHLELQGEGESFLHPRFFDMVAMARLRGVAVSLITNGSFLTTEAIGRLLDLGLAKLSFSLESADAERFREIRGGKLEKVVRGLEALLAERRRRGLAQPVVGMSVTVLRSTRDHLAAVLALYHQLGLDGGITLQPLERKADYATHYDPAMAAELLSEREADQVWVTFRASRELRRIEAERAPGRGFFDELMEGWRPGLRRCPWLDRGLYMNRLGEASPCCMVKDTAQHGLGRLGDDPLPVILARRAALRDQLAAGEIPKACAGCDLARFAVISKLELMGWGMKGLYHLLFGRRLGDDPARRRLPVVGG